ncbi:MAG: hypothetical protein NT030_07195, partial [Candidatus Saganbacteria bacterium]|nr:hypothetical protein [Candidatus Saganbacteria bacterium]
MAVITRQTLNSSHLLMKNCFKLFGGQQHMIHQKDFGKQQNCFYGNLAMNDWLIKSKDQFQGQIFDFLWRQWSTLGIAGITKSKDNRIIDPEALLLFSLSVCRYEPRLFDEVIDWLFQNGRCINVQRLQQIQLKYDFHCGPQLSAVAELLSKKSSYKLK